MTIRTIQQALREETVGFEKLEAAVFTTFNFDPEFFENNVLPALFGIECRREETRRRQVNDALHKTEVCVLDDASTCPRGGGIYRYGAVSHFRRDGFFHPKIAILAGIRKDYRSPWIYLTASSANLTLSGWGKNQEVIGEARLGNNRQKLFDEVWAALIWFKNNGAGKLGKPVAAIERCLEVMKRMGGDLSVGGSTDVSFYFSPLHEDGFLPFLQAGQTGRWDNLQVWSPYWGEIANNIGSANSRYVELVPAVLNEGKFGLGRSRIPEGGNVKLLRLAKREDDRFWHAKTYILTRGDRIRVGVGSANFTGAGLAGGSAGNVEAMLVFEAGPRVSFLPKLVPLSIDDPMMPQENLEGPEKAAFELTVLYDWNSREYTIFFNPAEDPATGDYMLTLPGLEPVDLEGLNGLKTFKDPKGPLLETSFRLNYLCSGKTAVFHGLINEINLISSDKPYFEPLTLLQILESWRRPADAPPPPKPPEGDDDTDTDDVTFGDDSNAPPTSAQFDILNLYEMYRSFYTLQGRLDEAVKEDDKEFLICYLKTRPDSIYRIAKQAGEDPNEHLVARFLVLLECRDIFNRYRGKIPSELANRFVQDLDSWISRLRGIVYSMSQKPQTDLPGSDVLAWFENEIKQAWRK